MQVVYAAGTPVHQQLPQRAHARGTPAGAMRDHQMGQLQQFLPLMPLRQAQEGIHTYDETKAPIRIFVPEFRQGIHGIRRAFLADLTIIHQDSRLPRRRQLHHLQPQLRVCQGLITVRRIARREKTNLLQAQCLLQFKGGAQVRIVNRIEGSAEYAHRVHELTLPESGVACKAPAKAPVRPVSALQASPGDMPLMTRSVWLAWISKGASGSFFRRDRARGEGVAAKFQPLPRAAERRRVRSRACHIPRSSRSSAHKISVGSPPSPFKPSSTRNARAASPAAAASASWNTS